MHGQVKYLMHSAYRLQCMHGQVKHLSHLADRLQCIHGQVKHLSHLADRLQCMHGQVKHLSQLANRLQCIHGQVKHLSRLADRLQCTLVCMVRSDIYHSVLTDSDVCMYRRVKKDEELKRKARMEKKSKTDEEISLQASHRQKEEEAQKRYEDWLRNKVCTLILGFNVQQRFVEWYEGLMYKMCSLIL